jgi:crotonobetainyl-CoA:carnitine CoA-transferase CaiB-like acyl-CoA transferase
VTSDPNSRESVPPPPGPPSPGPISGALDGVRVIDLSRVLAGPLGTMILGDLGADVIKVERPGSGDDLRAWGPPFTPEGESAYFLAVNRNKRSVTLDLKHPRGKHLLRDLVRSADVVVENFRVGTMDELGVGYDVLAAENPRLVYCAVSAYGLTGPYRDLPGYDIIIQAMGGLMSVTGEPDGAPMRAGVAVVDVLTGLYIALGVAAAVRERDRTGRGQRVDLSLLEVELASLVNIANNYLVAGDRPTRLGNAHPSVAPYEVFASADGHIAVAVATQAQWTRFCTAIEREALAGDPRAATNSDRVANRAWLTAEIATALRTRTTDAWIDRLRAADVPCGPVNSIDRIFEDPHVAGLGLVTSFPRGGREIDVVGSPLRFSGSERRPPVAPPTLGQHTDEVLTDLLGLSATEIEGLRASGAI